MISRLRINSILIGMLLFVFTFASAQDPAPVPTLVSPTRVPVAGDGASDALLSESAIARIVADGRVRVGILYNEPPFGELNIRGEVVGYDAALARSMAEIWGVELEFVQVTRQNAVERLNASEVDMLIAARVHRRAMDEQVEFSQTYYRGTQAMMVRVDDEATVLNQLGNRRVGVVLGTSSEVAVVEWQQRMGLNVSVESYLTLGQAITALVAGEVDGVVEKRYRLRPLVQPDLMRVLDEPVQPEPYGIAVRRQDVNFRNLVNRTLQHLMESGRLAEIYGEFFPARLPQDAISVWDNLGEDAPTPANFGTDVPFPPEYALPRVQASGVLRVAGVPQSIPEQPEAERRIATTNAALAESIASRWGIQVEFVGADDPLGKVERGEADLALGVRPDWNAVNQVDFTSAYTLRGKRLMTTVRDDHTSLADLRGEWIGVFASEPGTDALVTELGAGVNASLNVFTVLRDQDAAFEMLEENNIDAMFGDSVRLLPHVEADPETLKLSTRCDECDPWYTREYYGMAVQRNDLDFRLLVEYTLQELAQGGQLETILRPVTGRGEANLVIDVWPGPDEFMGVQFGG